MAIMYRNNEAADQKRLLAEGAAAHAAGVAMTATPYAAQPDEDRWICNAGGWMRRSRRVRGADPAAAGVARLVSQAAGTMLPMIVDTYRWVIQPSPRLRAVETQYHATEEEIRVRYPMAQRVADSWRPRLERDPNQLELFAA